jgi:hypothetical protein
MNDYLLGKCICCGEYKYLSKDTLYIIYDECNNQLEALKRKDDVYEKTV